jgi:hypothetical protein
VTVPIIFVNGIYGSGGQYRTQAMRWASNGYSPDLISAFDYNVDASGLDAYVDSVRAKFNVPKVQLVGHSLGTAVLNSYMGTASQKAKVEKWILVDGLGCPSGDGSCLAIAASSLPAVGGGNQTHVEASVSPESFAKQYQFFLGKAPTTTSITPEADPKIGGKVLEFTANTPVAGSAMALYETNPATGMRVGAPAATGTTTADGSFGPWPIDGTKTYEISSVRAGSGTFHYYMQPFVRSSYILRLNSLAASSATFTNTARGADHTVLAVVRYREFWRSHGATNDTLTVKAGSLPAVNVFQNVTGDVVGVHIHDNGTPGTSSLGLISYFGTQPFQTGVDVSMPATNPPSQTITVSNAPRGNTSKTQTVNFPNWSSSTDFVEIEFTDAPPA